MPNTTVRAAAEGMPVETRDIGDAIDLLCRAISVNELIFMVGESIAIRDMKEAITTGANVIDGVLGDPRSHRSTPKGDS